MVLPPVLATMNIHCLLYRLAGLLPKYDVETNSSRYIELWIDSRGCKFKYQMPDLWLQLLIILYQMQILGAMLKTIAKIDIMQIAGARLMV